MYGPYRDKIPLKTRKHMRIFFKIMFHTLGYESWQYEQMRLDIYYGDVRTYLFMNNYGGEA